MRTPINDKKFCQGPHAFTGELEDDGMFNFISDHESERKTDIASMQSIICCAAPRLYKFFCGIDLLFFIHFYPSHSHLSETT